MSCVAFVGNSDFYSFIVGVACVVVIIWTGHSGAEVHSTAFFYVCVCVLVAGTVVWASYFRSNSRRFDSWPGHNQGT